MNQLRLLASKSPSNLQLHNTIKSMQTMSHHLFFLLLFSFCCVSFANMSADYYSLQSFKSSADRLGLLSSWNPATEPCSGSWLGVYCLQGRVTRLVLEGLSLNGTIKSLSSLPRLRVLSLKNNTFSDSLHLLNLSLWQPHLKLLYLSNNHFRGPFPESVILLRHLHRLDLSGNFLSGKIPDSIGSSLPCLLTLRIEKNLLSGDIPGSFGMIQGLADLNLSCNQLTGQIPVNLSSFLPSSFRENAGLCGKPLTVKCCPKRKNGNKMKYWILILFLIVIVSVMATVLLVAVLLFILKKRKQRKEGGTAGQRDDDESVKGYFREEKLVFFEGCQEFVMEDLMRGSAEMLGRGVVGSTYRVLMEGGRDSGGVVVKRVRKERLGKERRQWMEVEELVAEIGRWRHPNVVSLLAYYSSEDELLLVFQYATKGSLHNLLHGNRGPGRTPLDWTARFKIALDAAKGLSFLHEASNFTLTHEHLTSSNILISEDGNALISDFALHQLLAPPPISSASPEAIRNNNLKCNVYSFGVVLLEILTGRTQGEDGMDIAGWVKMVVREEWTSEVFDIELSKGMEDEMVALLQVALLCLTSDHKSRPKMSIVHRMIQDVKERGSKIRRGSDLSPNENSYESSPGLSDDTATFTTD